MCHLLFSLILQYHADLEISNFCLTGFIHIYSSCIFILVSSREDSRIKNLHSSRLQTSFFNLHVLMSCHEDVLLSCYEDTLLACILACIFFACLLAFLFACIQAFVPLRYALMHAQMHEPMHTQHCKPMVIRPICQDKGRRYCRTWCGRVPTWGSAPLSRSWWARGICSSPTSKAWLHTRPSIRTFPCGSGACDCPAPAVLPAPTCAADAHDCGRWDSRKRLWGFLYSSAPRTMHFGRP